MAEMRQDGTITTTTTTTTTTTAAAEVAEGTGGEPQAAPTWGPALDEVVAWTGGALEGVFEPWPIEVRCLDLGEEVGELCRAVLVHQGHKEPPAEELGEALCGVLVDVFALAHALGLSLGSLYPERLSQLVGRLLPDGNSGVGGPEMGHGRRR